MCMSELWNNIIVKLGGETNSLSETIKELIFIRHMAEWFSGTLIAV